MTPEIKAAQLVNKYFNFIYLDLDYEQAIQCALIAVDEILNEFPQGFKGNFEERRKEYWNEVKQEIEAL
jgi:hypothetical protein